MYIDAREHPDEARKYVALLNGNRVKYAAAANSDEGWIEYYVYDPRYQGLAVDSITNSIAVARVYGAVSIVPKEEHAST